MYLLLALLGYLSQRTEGAAGCKELKKEYPSYKIRRRPLRDSNGTCSLERSCCSEDVERAVRDDALLDMRNVVRREVDNARSSVAFVRSQAEGTTKRMIGELFPAEVAELVDVDAIAEIIWRYSVGELSAVDLVIEGAVTVMFTERAEQSLRDMTGCVMRELRKHATTAFQRIADVVDELLKAPRTFGQGLQVAEELLSALETTQLSQPCNYDELFGCRKCGVKLPAPCWSSCVASSRKCFLHINSVTPLWPVWVDSIASLTDALVLMKDIPMAEPTEMVDEEMLAEITGEIFSAMANADFRQCMATTKRMKREVRPKRTGNKIPGRRQRRDFSEGEMLKLTLEGSFLAFEMESNLCSDANSDTECWLGNRVGDVDENMLTELEEESSRITKAYTGMDLVNGVVHGYAAKVDEVIAEIHEKVKAARTARYLAERSRRRN